MYNGKFTESAAARALAKLTANIAFAPELLFVRRPVHLQQCRVHLLLIDRVHANQFFCDLLVDLFHGVQYTLAEIAVFVAVP